MSRATAWLVALVVLWLANAVVVAVEVWVHPGIVAPVFAGWSGGVLTTLLAWRLFVLAEYRRA